MKVAIIGGGIMGCSTALALAERGADVVLLERAIPGAEASSAAAGILGAQVELHGEMSVASEFLRAREAWRGWASHLRELTGIDVGHRVSGVLRVAFDAAQRAGLEEDVARQRALGLRAELLEGEAARRVEPGLAPEVIAASHFPDDAQVDPQLVLRALVAALASTPGVHVRRQSTVSRLLVEHDRCVGVALEDGEVRADATVLAAGSWSSLVGGMPAGTPTVRPVRGQVVLLDERPPTVHAIVFGPGGYVVPRGDGRVLCGSTMEHVGFRKEVTAAGVHAVLGTALACVPSLGRRSSRARGATSVPTRRAIGRSSVLRGSRAFSWRPGTTATASCCRRSPPTTSPPPCSADVASRGAHARGACVHRLRARGA